MLRHAAAIIACSVFGVLGPTSSDGCDRSVAYARRPRPREEVAVPEARIVQPIMVAHTEFEVSVRNRGGAVAGEDCGVLLGRAECAQCCNTCWRVLAVSTRVGVAAAVSMDGRVGCLPVGYRRCVGGRFLNGAWMGFNDAMVCGRFEEPGY